MINDVLSEAQDRMDKAVEALQNDLRAIRTGRASPALVERLKVDYYGTATPLNQLATISAPEPRLLTIRPWDASALSSIEKAIQRSDLGLTPANDGKIIRLNVPRLNEERRQELVKVVTKRVEEGRVAIRNVRRGAIDDLRELEKEKMISEDELHKGRERIQELTDQVIEQVDDIGKAKEKEILEV
jgi:ribosome recycling factor